jgi:tetratricopeptide (TPR) repeat protein
MPKNPRSRPARPATRPTARDVVAATLDRREAPQTPLPEEVEATRRRAARPQPLQASLDRLAEQMRIAKLFGDTKDLVAKAREACALAPDALELTFQLAEILHESGDFTGAEEALVAAEASFSGGSQVHVYRARMFLARGEVSEALQALNAAIEAFPRDLHARSERAALSTEHREADCRVILAADPNDGYALRLLASHLGHLGKTKEARMLLDRAIAHSPADPDARIARALQADTPAAALTDFDAALRAVPLGATIYASRAAYFAGRGDSFRAALDGAAVWVLARIGAPVRAEESERARGYLAEALGKSLTAEERATLAGAVAAFSASVGPAEGAMFAALFATPIIDA